MSIELKMPALSPTMEEGTLAKWLVKEGDSVVSGDILAEIETDKATMEFEAVDEGTIAKILVPEGSDGVKVGTVIALMGGDEASPSPPAGEGDSATAERGEGTAKIPEPEQSTPAAPLPHPAQPSAESPSPARGEGLEVSPSPPISAITVPTLTPSLPSGTRIFAIVPSSTASNSIVALSVSISANMSPLTTLSPSLTSHLASVPSSIVGDKAGILSSIDIYSGPVLISPITEPLASFQQALKSLAAINSLAQALSGRGVRLSAFSQ